jgi:hypothetical protein
MEELKETCETAEECRKEWLADLEKIIASERAKATSGVLPALLELKENMNAENFTVVEEAPNMGDDREAEIQDILRTLYYHGRGSLIPNDILRLEEHFLR